LFGSPNRSQIHHTNEQKPCATPNTNHAAHLEGTARTEDPIQRSDEEGEFLLENHILDILLFEIISLYRPLLNEPSSMRDLEKTEN
jgi:hypothetical protein